MEFFQLATTCAEDVSSCCSDYGIATFLHIMKTAMGIIQVVVPIILIVMCAIDFAKMVINPDDQNKAKSKSTMTKFAAAIIIFLLPIIFNLLMSLLPDSFEISACWNAADDVATGMFERDDEDYNTLNYGYESESTTTSSSDSSSSSKSDASKVNKTKKTSKSTAKKTGSNVVKYAKQFNGESYRYGGSWNGDKPYRPTDCSGFVSGVYKHFGYSLPRTAASQAASSYKKVSVSTNSLKKGDLIFYSGSTGISHVAMYIGNGKIIHASNSRDGVKISSYNYRTPTLAKRIIS